MVDSPGNEMAELQALAMQYDVAEARVNGFPGRLQSHYGIVDESISGMNQRFELALQYLAGHIQVSVDEDLVLFDQLLILDQNGDQFAMQLVEMIRSEVFRTNGVLEKFKDDMTTFFMEYRTQFSAYCQLALDIERKGMEREMLSKEAEFAGKVQQMRRSSGQDVGTQTMLEIDAYRGLVNEIGRLKTEKSKMRLQLEATASGQAALKQDVEELQRQLSAEKVRAFHDQRELHSRMDSLRQLLGQNPIERPFKDSTNWKENQVKAGNSSIKPIQGEFQASDLVFEWITGLSTPSILVDDPDGLKYLGDGPLDHWPGANSRLDGEIAFAEARDNIDLFEDDVPCATEHASLLARIAELEKKNRDLESNNKLLGQKAGEDALSLTGRLKEALRAKDEAINLQIETEVQVRQLTKSREETKAAEIAIKEAQEKFKSEAEDHRLDADKYLQSADQWRGLAIRTIRSWSGCMFDIDSKIDKLPAPVPSVASEQNLIDFDNAESIKEKLDADGIPSSEPLLIGTVPVELGLLPQQMSLAGKVRDARSFEDYSRLMIPLDKLKDHLLQRVVRLTDSTHMFKMNRALRQQLTVYMIEQAKQRFGHPGAVLSEEKIVQRLEDVGLYSRTPSKAYCPQLSRRSVKPKLNPMPISKKDEFWRYRQPLTPPLSD
jgi:hypothetical protein